MNKYRFAIMAVTTVAYVALIVGFNMEWHAPLLYKRGDDPYLASAVAIATVLKNIVQLNVAGLVYAFVTNWYNKKRGDITRVPREELWGDIILSPLALLVAIGFLVFGQGGHFHWDWYRLGITTAVILACKDDVRPTLDSIRQLFR